MEAMILGIYVLVGVGAALVVIRSGTRIGTTNGAGAALIMLVFWPFLLPGVVAAQQNLSRWVTRGETPSEREQRIDALAGKLSMLFVSAGGDARERMVLDAFMTKVRLGERRLAEMESTMQNAPSSVIPRLEAIANDAEHDLEESVRLLEEIVAQMTVLRFTELADSEEARAERERVEDMLLRIEACADLSQRDRTALG
jgi:hypothetical protein